MIKEGAQDIYNSKKIIDYKTAIKKIAELKSQSKTIGLCHGGFDMLHPGHIKHLESAKKLCNYLFVSITSDKFVSLRKGSGRPIYSDKLRAYHVASLEFVDFVVISDVQKATEIIAQLKPSYYIKGPDFIGKTTPGITAEREAIKSVGGEIKYTNDPKLSTTEIIKHIKEAVNQKKILIGIDRDGTLIEQVDFLGKNKNWKEEIKLQEDVISLLSYIKTKHDATFIVLTNQAGVARGYFGPERAEEINAHLATTLAEKGIKVQNWQYCPDVDSKYAESKKGEIEFKPDYVKDETARKPSPAMLLSALEELKASLEEFDAVVVIGDRHEDEELAKNLNANFIDVKEASYDEMKKGFDELSL